MAILCIAKSGFSQYIELEKMLYPAKSEKNTLEKALKSKNYDNVKKIVINYYADSIFPNEDILKFRNLESICIIGLFKHNKEYPEINKPIRLKIDIDNIKKIKNLKTLSISSFDLRNFPDELFELKNLKALSIGCSYLNEIPNKISNLNELEYLELRLNNIKNIPIELSKMENLIYLDLANNLFTEIPKELLNIKSLKNINLSNTEIAKKDLLMLSFDKKEKASINNINYLKNTELLIKILESNQLESIIISKQNNNIKKELENQINNKSFFKKIIFKN